MNERIAIVETRQMEKLFADSRAETAMKKEEIKKIMGKLLREIEEEDIGICLFSTFYQGEEDLLFFQDDDRERVMKILKKISDDSKRHKSMLGKIIDVFGEKIHGK